MNKKERMYKNIEEHGEDLKRIIKTELDGITLSKRLFSLENKGHRLAEQYCNGDMTEEAFDVAEYAITKKVAKLTGFSTKDGLATAPLYFNRDPRGYYLKLDDGYVKDNNIKIHKDWGGYGILAPDFNE